MGHESPLFKTRVQPTVFLPLKVLRIAFQSKGSKSQRIQRYYIMTNKIQVESKCESAIYYWVRCIYAPRQDNVVIM